MKIPKKIKIGGNIYRVILVEAKELEDVGEIDNICSTIKIRKDATQTQQEDALIHEIIHGLNFHLTDEQVGFLANGIYQTLKDNNLLTP